MLRSRTDMEALHLRESDRGFCDSRKQLKLTQGTRSVPRGVWGDLGRSNV